MRAPRRGVQQLDFLRHQQRPKLRGKTFDEVAVRVHCLPMPAAVRVVLEFPQMHQLIDRAGIALEIADQFSVLPAFLQRRVAKLLVQLYGLRHLPDIEGVSPQLVQRHGDFLPQSTRVIALSSLVWRQTASAGFHATSTSGPGYGDTRTPRRS